MTKAQHAILERESASRETWTTWILRTAIGVVLAALAFPIIETVITALTHPIPSHMAGLWVDSTGTAAIIVGSAKHEKWSCHTGSQGYLLEPKLFDPENGVASGKVYCDAGGHAVGEFRMGPNAADPNRLDLTLVFSATIAKTYTLGRAN